MKDRIKDASRKHTWWLNNVARVGAATEELNLHSKRTRTINLREGITLRVAAKPKPRIVTVKSSTGMSDLCTPRGMVTMYKGLPCFFLKGPRIPGVDKIERTYPTLSRIKSRKTLQGAEQQAQASAQQGRPSEFAAFEGDQGQPVNQSGRVGDPVRNNRRRRRKATRLRRYGRY